MKIQELPLGEFANDPAEVHAIMHGFYAGFFRFDPRKIPTDIEDVKGETHYYKFGYVCGWIGKLWIITSTIVTLMVIGALLL